MSAYRMVPSRMGTATLVSIFSAWDAGTLPLLTLPVSVIQRAPEDLAWQGSGMLPTLSQHLAIDDHVVDPESTLLHVHRATWQVVHQPARLGGNGVGVEDDDVGSLIGLPAAGRSVRCARTAVNRSRAQTV